MAKEAWEEIGLEDCRNGSSRCQFLPFHTPMERPGLAYYSAIPLMADQDLEIGILWGIEGRKDTD